jgi:hypothetical protein
MPILISGSWAGGQQTIPQDLHCYTCLQTCRDLASAVSAIITELGFLVNLTKPCPVCGRTIRAKSNWVKARPLRGSETVLKEGVL